MQNHLSSDTFALAAARFGKRSKQKNDNHQLHIQGDENIEEDLPDRIVNPDMYQPLLPSTNVGDGPSDTQPQAGVNSLVAYGSM